MTVRNLMAGYTAYTDAQELAATRGAYRDVFVTTTETTTNTATTTFLFADSGPENASDAPVLTVVRHVPENA